MMKSWCSSRLKQLSPGHQALSPSWSLAIQLRRLQHQEASTVVWESSATSKQLLELSQHAVPLTSRARRSLEIRISSYDWLRQNTLSLPLGPSKGRAVRAIPSSGRGGGFKPPILGGTSRKCVGCLNVGGHDLWRDSTTNESSAHVPQYKQMMQCHWSRMNMLTLKATGECSCYD
jgi:hypothetical protein